MSLRHFYSFCLTEDLGINIPTAKILSQKEKMARWSSSLRKGCSKRHWEKMEEDLHSLISPEHIGEFERSKAARDAICLIGQLSGAHSVVLSQSQYTLIRDFLLVEISIDNANRAGALANMKVPGRIYKSIQTRRGKCCSCKESQNPPNTWSSTNCSQLEITQLDGHFRTRSTFQSSWRDW